jgi:hypothetical protein
MNLIEALEMKIEYWDEYHDNKEPFRGDKRYFQRALKLIKKLVKENEALKQC